LLLPPATSTFADADADETADGGPRTADGTADGRRQLPSAGDPTDLPSAD
jgi:hypothetical protein